VIALLGVSGAAFGQQQEVAASLPFAGGQTAGIVARVIGLPSQEGDIWVMEDFSIDRAYMLTDFTSHGTVNPTQYVGFVDDVFVRIMDDYPPNGEVILESVPGAGSYTHRTLGTSTFQTDFGGQLLEPGAYIIMWAASLPDPNGRCIMWHQPGPHAVGGGEPDNAFYWRPFTGELIPVPLHLGGGGRSGMNFVLEGVPAGCYADCDTSTGAGVLDVFDFLCFQDLFVAGDPYACDCDTGSGAGVCDVFDFLCFQDAFVAGCP
jgi:hypothetical protein